MKNEFKSGYTYITKDGRPATVTGVSIDNLLLVEYKDDSGFFCEYNLDGTCRMVNGNTGKHSSHLDLVPGIFSREDAFKEMKLGKRSPKCGRS